MIIYISNDTWLYNHTLYIGYIILFHTWGFACCTTRKNNDVEPYPIGFIQIHHDSYDSSSWIAAEHIL